MARPGCRAAPSKGPLGERIAYGIFELTAPYHLGAGSASDLFGASGACLRRALPRLHDVPERLPDRLDPATVDAEIPVPLPRCGADVDHPGGLVDPEFHVVHEPQPRPELGADEVPRRRDDAERGKERTTVSRSSRAFAAVPVKGIGSTRRAGSGSRLDTQLGDDGQGRRSASPAPAAEARRDTPGRRRKIRKVRMKILHHVFPPARNGGFRLGSSGRAQGAAFRESACRPGCDRAGV